jgi:hypothetical protein
MSDNGDYVAIYALSAIGLSVPSGSRKDCTTCAKVARAVFPGMETRGTRGTSRISPTECGPENVSRSDPFWVPNRECTYSFFRLS